MTLVAGVALKNAVLIAADTRATYRGGIYSDSVQKLFLVAPGTAIGFAADDGHAAARLLHRLLHSIPSRARQDPASLFSWIPRFLRHHHRRISGAGPSAGMTFLVAFSFHDRPAVVRRRAFFEWMQQLIPNGASGHLPGWFMEVVAGPGEWARLEGCPFSGLYSLAAPDFRPNITGPLGYAVIGSGVGAAAEIERSLPHIHLEQGGAGPYVEELMFRSALQEHIVANHVPTVGGLFPMLRLEGSTVEYVGMDAQIPMPHGPKFELTVENGAWVQRNLTDGRSIALVPPWRVSRQDLGFNDITEALRHWRAQGPFWWGQGSTRCSPTSL